MDMERYDRIFCLELNKTNLFEVVPVSRLSLFNEFGLYSINSTDLIPHAFLETWESRLGVDAVLFTDFTAMRAYKPVTIGVRSKLVDVATGKILWSFDTVFDSGLPSIGAAARKFQCRSQYQSYPLNSSTSIFQSPLRFAQYAAHAAFGTMPKRQNENELTAGK